jgi:hypothetical protein
VICLSTAHGVNKIVHFVGLNLCDLFIDNARCEQDSAFCWTECCVICLSTMHGVNNIVHFVGLSVV